MSTDSMPTKTADDNPAPSVDDIASAIAGLANELGDAARNIENDSAESTYVNGWLDDAESAISGLRDLACELEDAEERAS